MKLFRLILMAVLIFPATSLAKTTLTISAIKGSADAFAGVAVLEEAYSRVGIGMDVQWHLGNTGLKMVDAGQIDAELQRVDGIEKTYKNLIQVPVPINFIHAGVFAKGLDFPVTGWHSLRSFSIGVVRGVVFTERGARDFSTVETTDYEQLLGGLLKGRFDVAVMPRINGLAAIKKHKIQGIVELEGVLETLFLYHYVNRKNADLVPKLERVLKKMLHEGTTRRLRDQVNRGILSGKR